jgi:hypothetical protein
VARTQRQKNMRIDWGYFYGVTGHFSAEQTGAAVMLMAHYWAHKMVGIPDDDVVMCRVARISPRRWRNVKGPIMGPFYLKDGLWHFRFPGIWAEEDRDQIPTEVRRAVLDRDGSKCRYCGDEDGPFHFDHYLPFARGGLSTVENLRVACARCNLSKSAMMPEDWEAKRGSY